MKLIPKEKAPKCINCGRTLWRIHWDRHNKSAGLGYTPNHRPGPKCWNAKLCEQRGKA